MDKKNLAVIFLAGQEGYKISSYYGKILKNGQIFATLDSAKAECDKDGLEYIVA